MVIKPGEENDLADYRAIMNTKLKNVFFACAEVGKMMLKRGSGAMINVASLAPTITLGTEWAPRGVRVNTVAQPRDFAGIAVFLASGASNFVNGAGIIVDGGYSIQL